MSNVTWNNLPRRANWAGPRYNVTLQAHKYSSVLTEENDGVIVSVWEWYGNKHASFFLTLNEAKALRDGLQNAITNLEEPNTVS